MGILTYLLLLILLLLPLGETTKLFLGNNIALNGIDILVVVISFFWLGYLGITKKIRLITSHSLWKPMAFFVGIALVSLLINIYRYTPLQLGVAGLYLIRWFCFSCLVFITASLTARPKNIIGNALSITGILCVFGGFIQVLFYPNLANLKYLGWDIHLYRMFTLFFDPNFGGAVFVLVAIYLLGMFFVSYEKKKKLQTVLFGLGEAITLVALFLTYSRSAYIMFFVSLVAFLILKKRTIILVPIIGLFLIGMVIASRNFYIENINIFRIASSEARLEAAGSALSIIQKNPILGVGFNAYRYAQLSYGYRSPIGASMSHADAGTDNSFLFVLATTGIIGLISYLYLWYCIQSIILGKNKLLLKKLSTSNPTAEEKTTIESLS